MTIYFGLDSHEGFLCAVVGGESVKVVLQGQKSLLFTKISIECFTVQDGSHYSKGDSQ